MASRRQYVSQEECEEMIDVNFTDAAEADDRISQCEEIIDSFVGPQQQFIAKRYTDIQGLISAVSGNTFTLEARHQNVNQADYFTYCEVEIIGGSGKGQRFQITGSTLTGILTLAATPSPVLDTTSFYRIYQLGKFPRTKDVYFDSIHQPARYYKNIPEEIKRATAAQVEFMIEQGDDYFRSNDVFINSEQIGSYQYDKTRDGSGTGITQLIAPKAKMFLQGFVNRKGVIII